MVTYYDDGTIRIRSMIPEDAQCDINNPASFGVMRKIGMKCVNDKGTRTYPRTGITSGEYTCMITRDEWENLKLIP